MSTYYNIICIEFASSHFFPISNLQHISAYAMEFVDRPGKPLFAVERYIAGSE